MKRARPPRSLRARALQWLAQREHSRLELRRKLLRAADDAHDPATLETTAETTREAEVDAVLDWLEAHRYLSVERFAESRVQARAGRFGNLRIRHELAQHAVALAPEAERALAESELARARAVRERKFGAEAPESAEARARQSRFLAARGFSSDAIRQALRAPRDTDA